MDYLHITDKELLMPRIYMDHSATTPVDPEVIEAMLPYLSDHFGNPSSIHAYGRDVKVALEDARETVAGFINADAGEIVFTSGGTESDNMAITGAALFHKVKGRHIITSRIEHHAVLHTCQYLEKQGFSVTYLAPDSSGMISAASVDAAIRDDTILITIMHANNEVGTINPVMDIGALARQRNILFHTDAVQTFGKYRMNMKDMPVDLMSFSGHKIYGPKGIGGLFIRKGVQLEPAAYGGSHERNRRAGTENIPGIIGMARAVQVCDRDLEKNHQHMVTLGQQMRRAVIDSIPKANLNGHTEKRLPGLMNISFYGIEGESLLLSLDMKGIAASSGSACTSGSVEPSHVLLAMNVKPELAQSSIRFSLGRTNSEEDITQLSEVLPPIVERLRQMSPIN